MIRSFDPFIDSQSKVLVLGTCPGGVSLRRREYYADTDNEFWVILSSVLPLSAANVDLLTYDEKMMYLKSNQIALWDVLGECERNGSLDSAIRGGKPNDFRELFTIYPNIVCIAFNGTKAARLFRRHCRNDVPISVTALTLPSSSSTPGRYVKSLPEKNDSWSALRLFLASTRTTSTHMRD